MGNPSARHLRSLGHHEYTSAPASSPSLGPSSFWGDAGSCLRTRRRPGRPSRRWAPQRADIHPPRLNNAICQILESHRQHQLDSRCPNPHSFVAFSGLSGAFRSFLHGGLSNTCPQAVVALGAVVSHGQLSDNPKPKLSYALPETRRSESPHHQSPDVSGFRVADRRLTTSPSARPSPEPSRKTAQLAVSTP